MNIPFGANNFLDISLKKDPNSQKKFLEIYSDLPRPLLTEYNFFKGLSGGKLLFISVIDKNLSSSKLKIEKFKVSEIPQNLIEQEVKVITEGLKEEDKKKKSKDIEKKAIQRIKVGLVLNEFGEANKIKIEENEIQAEIQKQLRMMPGQEKFLMEY